jgi:hypothetical protein
MRHNGAAKTRAGADIGAAGTVETRISSALLRCVESCAKDFAAAIFLLGERCRRRRKHVARGGRTGQLRTKAIEVTVNFFLL